jgi:hypothetical protein
MLSRSKYFGEIVVCVLQEETVSMPSKTPHRAGMRNEPGDRE